MSRRARTAFAVSFALVLGVASDASAVAPIKIAVEAPLTGSQSSNGLDMLRGVQLAVREANAGKGVLGRRVKIVRADDKGDQANARRVARRVIKENVAAVIGPYNSSVGIVNLPIYLRNRVVPVHLTSTDDTRGMGITIQPKNSQIAPIEDAYVRSTGAKKVTMLVDDTPNGAFTVGMADRLQQRLASAGIAVSRISIKELADNVEAGYYASKVAEALATGPDLLYVSTYFPEGAEIAKVLAGGRRCTQVPDGPGERRSGLRLGGRAGAEPALRLQRRARRAPAAFREAVRAPVPHRSSSGSRACGACSPTTPRGSCSGRWNRRVASVSRACRRG